VTNLQGDQANESVLADRSGKDGPGVEDKEGNGKGKKDEADIELYDDCDPWRCRSERAGA